MRLGIEPASLRHVPLSAFQALILGYPFQHWTSASCSDSRRPICLLTLSKIAASDAVVASICDHAHMWHRMTAVQ
jgi:hypothetical protein